MRTFRNMLIAVVFPWLAVTLARGSKKQKRMTWILELAGHVPAVVYAMWVIVTVGEKER